MDKEDVAESDEVMRVGAISKRANPKRASKLQIAGRGEFSQEWHGSSHSGTAKASRSLRPNKHPKHIRGIFQVTSSRYRDNKRSALPSYSHLSSSSMKSEGYTLIGDSLWCFRELRKLAGIGGSNLQIPSIIMRHGWTFLHHLHHLHRVRIFVNWRHREGPMST